jgi:hypothetical protein
MIELLLVLLIAPKIFNFSNDSSALKRSWNKQRKRNQNF